MGWMHRSVVALAAFSYAGELAVALPSERPSTKLPQEQPPADDLPVPGQSHHPFADYPPIIEARQEESGGEGGDPPDPAPSGGGDRPEGGQPEGGEQDGGDPTPADPEPNDQAPTDPAPSDQQSDDLEPSPSPSNGPAPSASGSNQTEGDSDKVELRILPLGASIMSGQGSPEHSGLRKWVRMVLRNDGYPVNMVGTRRHGTDMKDNDDEATPGYLVSEVRDKLQRSLPYKPNVVIINAGTNNANQVKDVDQVYDQMDGILNDIWGYTDMADTCIILSTLIPTEDRRGTITALTINSDYRKLVKKYEGEKCIYLADMQPSGEGKDFISLDGDYWADSPKVHPNNEGHKRMAYVFYAAINRALKAGKVKKAAPKEQEDKTGCDKEFGTGIYAGALTQEGWGNHDGIYKHHSENKGVVLELDSDYDQDQWRFARLFSPEYDDLVGWFEYAENDHRFGVWKNSANGEGTFTKIEDMNPEKYCIPRGLHFIDMNADGLDDHVCIHPNGDISLSVNNGDGDGDKPPSFTDVDVIEITGENQADIVLGDIDGDGRGDYGIVDSKTWKMQWFRNGGTKDKTEFWEPLGERVDFAPPTGHGGSPEWRFEDLNGDGRDDMMWLDREGSVITYTNTRSCEKGRHGDGLNVAWRKALGASDTPHTHAGMTEFWSTKKGRSDLRSRVHFARIYGTKPAFGNFGVQDYVFFENIKDGKAWKFNMRVWKNMGEGGTKVLADGDKYGNMAAHEDGRMDYIWTWSTGKMHIFPHAEEEFITPDGDSYWGPETVMWTPPEELDRRDLHLEDWDGDGVDDIIWVDPKSGNVRVWINGYRNKQSWDDAFHEIDPPELECEHTRGIGIHDLAVRFADITGNGRADYLCIAKDGGIVGYTQDDDGKFEVVDQIKFAEWMDRANLRFADVNGDGKDDMIWIEKFNGDGHVWYNRGPGKPEDNDGSSFHWQRVDKAVYEGSQAGTCMYYPEFSGDHRADMHGIKGTWTNQAETWYNPSCGMTDVQGDDPEGVVDPKLPMQEDNPLDGPGPGEEGNETPGTGEGDSDDCRNLDHRKWRDGQCTDKYITSHADYDAVERWNGVDAFGGWTSALEFVECRSTKDLQQDSFSNVVSDFFHGPEQMYCDLWTDSGNKCSDLALQCHDTDKPAGYFVLNSMSRIYDVAWNLYSALDHAVIYAKDGSITEEFGLPPEKGMSPTLAVILDIFLVVYTSVSGFYWNKGLGARRGPNSGFIKDETNDMAKNGVTVAKDIYTMEHKAKDNLGLSIKLHDAMVDLVEVWKNATAETNKKLFDGSAESVAKLDTFMADGNMLDRESLADTDDKELGERIEKVMNAMMIYQAWVLSPDQYYPVLIREEIGCDEKLAKWEDKHYMTTAAYNTRFCGDETDNVSYWFLAGENYDKKCTEGFGGLEESCPEWDLPPGYSALEEEKYKISADDFVFGSIATYKANGGKNGYELPDTPTDEWLNQVVVDGVRTPGVFTVPICTAKEARDNWMYAFRTKYQTWAGFPCNPYDE